MYHRSFEFLILNFELRQNRAINLVHRSKISIAIYAFRGIIGETLIRSQSCHLKEREVICYSGEEERAA